MKRLALVLAALGAGPVFAAGWPMYGHDIRQSRFNAAETVISRQTVGSLHQVWFLQTGGPVTATPSEVDGVVYVGSWDHSFYALDARTGAVKWRVALATPRETRSSRASSHRRRSPTAASTSATPAATCTRIPRTVPVRLRRRPPR